MSWTLFDCIRVEDVIGDGRPPGNTGNPQVVTPPFPRQKPARIRHHTAVIRTQERRRYGYRQGALFSQSDHRLAHRTVRGDAARDDQGTDVFMAVQGAGELPP